MSGHTYAIEHDFALAGCGPVVICLWRDETTKRGIESARKVVDALAGRYPDGLGMLIVVEGTALMPGADERVALSKLLKHCSETTVASALVFEGEGFRAAAVRSLVSGLKLMARQPYPHRVFSEVDTAAKWLAPVLMAATGAPTTATTIIGAVETFRRDVRNAPPGTR